MIHFQKRNLGIEKVEEAKIYLARNDLDTDTGKTFLLKIQKFGRTGRDIDDTSFAERTAIGDTDDHPLHIGQVGDTQESAERICAVGSNQLIRIMHQFQIGKNISDADTKSLVAFLNTLTGEYKGKLLQ